MVLNKIETHYVFQSLSLLPEGYTLPSDRVKPLGTAQAILATKDVVSDKFVIINADDYYGSDAFKVAADFLNSLKPNATNQYANIAYEVINTITENGSVKRGVLSVDKEDKLIHLLESKIEKVEDKIVASPLDGAVPFEITPSTLVSMNMFCFTHDILDHIEKNFAPYLDRNKDNLLTCEYLIPILTEELVSRSEVEVKVLPTSSVWYGITYKEDKPKVVASLAKLMDEGEYPEGLWSK